MKHTVRTNKHDGTGRVTIEQYTRGKAIVLQCTECMGFESDPKDCTSPNCSLFPYRKKTYMAYEKQEILDPVVEPSALESCKQTEPKALGES